MSEMSIREFLRRFNNEEFDSPCRSTQIDAGWYDWFCKDDQLRNKTYKLATKLEQLIKVLPPNNPKIDLDPHYVWFKNNCPMVGNLYDDFRIADMAPKINSELKMVIDITG